METEIIEKYGNKLRIRVCGICWHEAKLLMINHNGLRQGDFWAPPGGGVNYGESLEQVLIREFKEETGLTVALNRFLFVHEHIEKPLHAIELFYEVNLLGGNLIIGHDPETEFPVIQDVRWLTVEEMAKIPMSDKHRIFSTIKEPEDWIKIGGYSQLL